MKFSQKLIRGKLVKRYKRFLADVEIEIGEGEELETPGQPQGGLASHAGAACAAPSGIATERKTKIVTAHCPNSGRMTGLDTSGFEVWMSEKTGNLKYGLELVDTGKAIVGINTMHPNKIVSEAIAANKIPELAGYASLRREVKYGKNSRIDILLENPIPQSSYRRKPVSSATRKVSDDALDTGLRRYDKCYVEIKNVHLKRGEYAEFPDAVSERAAKHMHELEEVVKQGSRAVVFFLCQRSDAEKFQVAKDIDPAYNEAFLSAVNAGVEAICYRCQLSPDEISLEKRIEIIF